MLGTVRAEMIEGVNLTTVGLAQIDDSLACLQLPFMIRSYEELDYILQHIGPELEKKLEGSGFKLLFWSDSGWIHTFSKQPVHTMDDLRKMKLLTSSGDSDTERIYRDLGFSVRPLSREERLSSLNKNMINAVNLPPYFVFMERWHRIVPNMTAIKWNPRVTGTVIDLEVWNKIPDEYRSQMLTTARKASDKFLDAIRKSEEDSIKQMQMRGLKVVELTDAEIADWQREAAKVYPQLRGRSVPEDYFDEVQRLVIEFREMAQ